jgi:hypothetical protein
MYANAVSNTDDADADPTNEIQDLNLDNNILTISGNPNATAISLAAYQGTNTDNQELNLTGTDLSITGGNSIDVSSLVNDTDADPTNELQNLTFSGDTLGLENGNHIIFPYDSSRWAINGQAIYYNTGNVGIGSSTPRSKLEVKADASFTVDDTLFSVKDKDGNIVFAVFPDGAKVYVNEGVKGRVGGFAVTGRNPTKAPLAEEEYLRVTPDSTRIWVTEDPTKARVGGFAVTGRNPTKGMSGDYLVVTSDSTRIYINDTTTTKRRVGGFAVTGRNPTKGPNDDYLRVTRDSTRVYVTESETKGRVGGFAVTGRNPTKGDITSDYFNISGNENVETVNSDARIFWYPKKEAFLTGRVLVESPDSVGTNSMATGFESKAIGDYSQAMGYKAVARGDYSTAIGDSSIANGVSSFAFGEGVIASGENSFAFGSFGRNESGVPTGVKTEARGNNSVAFGLGALALNTGSYAFGSSDTSSGKWSFAIGGKSHASGDYSLAMGYNTKAKASVATAIGNGAVASGTFSSSIGGFAQSSGLYSVAIGNSSASNDYAVAIGYLAKSESLNSLSFGNNTKATAPYAMALGNNTIASGNYATALTTNSRAAGLASVAVGHLTEARGDYSLAIGYFTEAPGNYSSATGMGTISQQMGSFVTGRYNIPKGDSLNYSTSYPLFIVGNGTDESTRKNALEIYPDGRSLFWGEAVVLGAGSISLHTPEITLSEAGFGIPSSYWKEWSFKGIGKRLKIYETNSSGSNVRLTFDDGGDIGIGTELPAAKLDIAATGDGANILQLSTERGWAFQQEGTGASTSLRLRNVHGPNKYFHIDTDGGISARSADGSTTYLRINHGNGNVGIGLTGPAYKLDVYGEITSRSNNAFRMRNTNYSAIWRNDNNDIFLMLTNYGNPDGGWNDYRPFIVDLSNGNTSISKAIYVMHDGDVSIGTSTYKAQLYVEDNMANIGAIRAESKYTGTSNHYAGAFDAISGTKGTGVFAAGSFVDFYAGGPGANYGPFTGSHEVVLTKDFPKDAKAGLIVSVTGNVKKRHKEDGSISISSTMPEVKLAAKENDKAVFGAFIVESSLPDKHWLEENGRYATVNALGEGRVYVTDINGNIEAGDYITTSVVPGYGQKQDDDLLHNYTLGKATENVNWSNVTETIIIDGKEYKVYLIAVVYTSG